MRTLSAERIELIDALVAEANIGDITAGLLVKRRAPDGCPEGHFWAWL